MAKADDLILDTDSDDETEETFEFSPENNNLTARRRLEEYMEMKKLRELTEF